MLIENLLTRKSRRNESVQCCALYDSLSLYAGSAFLFVWLRSCAFFFLQAADSICMNLDMKKRKPILCILHEFQFLKPYTTRPELQVTYFQSGHNSPKEQRIQFSSTNIEEKNSKNTNKSCLSLYSCIFLSMV